MRLHICSTCFEKFTKHTKIHIMLLSFWLHVGIHQTFMTLQHKGVQSYELQSLVGHLKKQNLEARCPDDNDVHGQLILSIFATKQTGWSKWTCLSTLNTYFSQNLKSALDSQQTQHTVNSDSGMVEVMQVSGKIYFIQL